MNQTALLFLQIMESPYSLVENYLIMFLCIIGFYSCSRKVGNRRSSQKVDVLVAGAKTNGATQSVAKFWANGVATVLSPGIADQEWATSIFVSGKDVYVCGNEFNEGCPNSVAKYWKNGNPIPLTDGSEPAYAHSIVVSGSDIYIAGIEADPSTRQFVAKYWKNGIPVNLTDGSAHSGANGIAVSGDDIYVVGYDGPRAKYWKNGIPVELSLGSVSDMAHSIFLVSR
jgi:hypothetical protein